MPLHSFNLDSNNSISDSTENVKNQNRVYLEAAENGDIETAQKMVDNYAIEQGFDLAEDGTPEAQLKSADPITYDDNGNVIPLTERFNQKNDDIRYSKRVNLSNKRLTNGKGKRYNKNSTYDEFRTNGMQWAYNSKTQTGDIGYVFNPRKGKHCILEATKTGEGFIVVEELSSEEWSVKYGQTKEIRSEGRGLYRNTDQYESVGRGSSYDSNRSQYRGEDGRIIRLSEAERFQSDEAGNLERDGQDNQEV